MAPRLSYSRKLIARYRPLQDERSGATIATATISATDTCRSGRDASWHPTARRLAATIALARGDASLASELGELCAEGSALADRTCAPALELLIVTRLAVGGLWKGETQFPYAFDQGHGRLAKR